MKLKVGTAHNLYAALNRIDNNPAIKLPAEVRLLIAINMNRLQPEVQAYEKARNHIYVDMQGADGKGLINEPKASEEDLKLRDAEISVRLKKVGLAELKGLMKDQAITGLASLAPIIKDFDDGESDDEVEKKE